MEIDMEIKNGVKWMGGASKEEVFVREFVLGVGFVGGIFTRIGIDPEAEAFKALIAVVIELAKFISPSLASQISLLVWFLSIIIAIFSLISIYFCGRFIGLLAVGLAWLAGFFIVVNPLAGLLLLIISASIGILAPSSASSIDQTHFN